MVAVRWLLLAAMAVTVAACSSLPGLDGLPNMDAGAMGCNNVERTAAGAAASGKPTDLGQVFAHETLRDADPMELAGRGKAAGFVVRFNMQYSTTADGSGGYGECWCEAPLEGHVVDAFYGSEGQLFIQLERSPIPGGRSQPILGWGC